NEVCREFVRRVSDSRAVIGMTILSAKSVKPNAKRRRPAIAEVQYCVKTCSRKQAVAELYERLLAADGGKVYSNGKAANGAALQSENGRADHPEPHANGHLQSSTRSIHLVPDQDGVVRLYRHGPLFTTWQVKHEVPGRIRLYHPSLYRRKEVCQAIERE